MFTEYIFMARKESEDKDVMVAAVIVRWRDCFPICKEILFGIQIDGYENMVERGEWFGMGYRTTWDTDAPEGMGINRSSIKSIRCTLHIKQ